MGDSCNQTSKITSQLPVSARSAECKITEFIFKADKFLFVPLVDKGFRRNSETDILRLVMPPEEDTEQNDEQTAIVSSV